MQALCMMKASMDKVGRQRNESAIAPRACATKVVFQHGRRQKKSVMYILKTNNQSWILFVEILPLWETGISVWI